MTDLDASTDGPKFVYAGRWTNLDLLGRGETSLTKEVDVNNEGLFTTGVWYPGADDDATAAARETEERIVYEGGQYTYRLTMISQIGTTSKDMILYDSLENFSADDGNSPIDIGAASWQGTLRRVDVAQLVERGIAPVVYYCTQSGLELEDADGLEQNSLEKNPSIWTEASRY